MGSVYDIRRYCTCRGSWRRGLPYEKGPVEQETARLSGLGQPSNYSGIAR